MANIQQDLWISQIMENIFPDNSFHSGMIDFSQYLNYNTVVLPQTTAKSTIVRNRSSFPASASQRTDTVNTFTVAEFSTDPIHIQLTEAEVLSYDKRQSVLRQLIKDLEEKAGKEIAYGIAPTSSDMIVRTSGSARAGASWQSGNRKAVTYTDILKASKILNSQNVPMGGRKMLVTPELYQDLCLLSELQYSNEITTSISTTGAIGKILGYEVFLRSDSAKWNSGATALVGLDTSAATDSNAGIILWHDDFVAKAQGTKENGGVKVFIQENDPNYYGDVLSSLVRAGAKPLYTTPIGVVAIVETA